MVDAKPQFPPFFNAVHLGIKVAVCQRIEVQRPHWITALIQVRVMRILMQRMRPVVPPGERAASAKSKFPFLPKHFIHSSSSSIISISGAVQ